jgi:hypothetical protein
MRSDMATEETFLACVEDALLSNKKTEFSRSKKIQIRFLHSDGSDTLPEFIAVPLSDSGVEDPAWARRYWNIEMTYGQATRVRNQMKGDI